MDLGSLTHLLLNCLFVFVVFLLDVVEDVSEQGLIVHDESVDDSSVDVLRWKLIRIAFFDHFRHVCEVTRNGLCICLYYHVVVEDDVLQEDGVVWQVLQQRLELQELLVFVLQVVTGLLDQHFDISVRHLSQLSELLFGLLRLGVLLNIFERVVDVVVFLVFDLFFDAINQSFLQPFSDDLGLHLEYQIEINPVYRVVQLVQVLFLFTFFFVSLVFRPQL